MRRSTLDARELYGRSAVGHDFGLALPPDGDHAALAKAAASWNDACARSLRAGANRVARLEEARKRLRDARLNLVGAEAWRHFSEFSRQQRAELRTLLRTGAAADRRAAARRAREESIHLMERSGVRRQKLDMLFQEFKDELSRIVRPERSSAARLSVVPIDHVLRPVRDVITSRAVSTTTEDGLTIFTPPFDGWWWKGEWWHSGGDDAQIDIYPDPGSGAIGHRSEWYDFDASDDDALSLDYHTSISVWYKPPKSGVVDVWIWATCASAHWEIYLEDEWG